MANISTYLADQLLGVAFDYAPFSTPTPFLALFTTVPTMPAGTGGVEVSGGSYARLSISAGFGAPGSGSIANTSTFTFVTPTASWGTVTGFGIYDASTGGNLLWAEAFTTSVTIGTGVVASFAGGALTASLT